MELLQRKLLFTENRISYSVQMNPYLLAKMSCIAERHKTENKAGEERKMKLGEFIRLVVENFVREFEINIGKISPNNVRIAILEILKERSPVEVPAPEKLMYARLVRQFYKPSTLKEGLFFPTAIFFDMVKKCSSKFIGLKSILYFGKIMAEAGFVAKKRRLQVKDNKERELKQEGSNLSKKKEKQVKVYKRTYGYWAKAL